MLANSNYIAKCMHCNRDALYLKSENMPMWPCIGCKSFCCEECDEEFQEMHTIDPIIGIYECTVCNIENEKRMNGNPSKTVDEEQIEKLKDEIATLKRKRDDEVSELQNEVMRLKTARKATLEKLKLHDEIAVCVLAKLRANSEYHAKVVEDFSQEVGETFEAKLKKPDAAK